MNRNLSFEINSSFSKQVQAILKEHNKMHDEILSEISEIQKSALTFFESNEERFKSPGHAEQLKKDFKSFCQKYSSILEKCQELENEFKNLDTNIKTISDKRDGYSRRKTKPNDDGPVVTLMAHGISFLLMGALCGAIGAPLTSVILIGIAVLALSIASMCMRMHREEYEKYEEDAQSEIDKLQLQLNDVEKKMEAVQLPPFDISDKLDQNQDVAQNEGEEYSDYQLTA